MQRFRLFAWLALGGMALGFALHVANRGADMARAHNAPISAALALED